MKITLKQIKDKSPCRSGWEKLLQSFNKTKADSTLVTANHLLESNGVLDTLWVIFNCVPDRLEKKRNMLADFAEPAILAAESVLHIFEDKYPKDKRPRNAIENAKENVKRARSGLERLPRAYAADDAAAYADDAAAYAADAALKIGNSALAYAAAAAAYADAAAAYAADAALKIGNSALAYAANAAYAHRKAREKQKEIILRYFGE